MLTTDYHVHSVSPDAKVPMSEMCEGAIKQGVREIAFTDHYEFYAHGIHRKFFHEDYLKLYWENLECCREKFAGQLTIRSGMEFGQTHLCPDEAFGIIRKYPFDYLLGSIHKIENIDLEHMVYTERTVPQILESYYQNLIELSAKGEYDCLAHLDLAKRYAMKSGQKVDYDFCADFIDEILKNVIARGKGIEVNTSGLRQGIGETMPGLRTLKRYRELGGTIITVGSDAHRPQDVGADLNAAAALLKEAGFTKISSFERRRRIDGLI